MLAACEFVFRRHAVVSPLAQSSQNLQEGAGARNSVRQNQLVEILTSRVLLKPTDIDRSLRFYEHTLGLAIYREWGSGSDRGVVFFLGGGGLLEVSGHSPEPPSDAISLVLQVRDVHASCAHLAEAGVTIEAPPELKPWGLIEMTVRDPDGLALIAVEIPPEHPRRHG
jgi:catechol 2,3-dioxygenase-like lactoylglutathione lyase family enzyme